LVKKEVWGDALSWCNSQFFCCQSSYMYIDKRCLHMAVKNTCILVPSNSDRIIYGLHKTETWGTINSASTSYWLAGRRRIFLPVHTMPRLM
jgi:hypothetical protein